MYYPSFSEFRSRWQYYLRFSGVERNLLLVSGLVLGFVFSFKFWGQGGSVDYLVGFLNLLLISFLSVVALFSRVIVQRAYGLTYGFYPQFKAWQGGLVISLVLAFASNGVVTLALPGGVVSSLMTRHRLGEFRYGYNYWENGLIATAGSVVNLLLALVTKVFLYVFPDSFLLERFLVINIVMAVTMMLPIPPLDGINMFYASRLVYVFYYGIIIGISVLFYFAGILVSLLGGVLIGALLWFVYYVTYEQPPK